MGRVSVVAQAARTDSQLDDEYAADNFYQILGVPESASRRDIKRAYKAMMKDFHPDLSGDEESTEFAVLLNEIYSVGFQVYTLMRTAAWLIMWLIIINIVLHARLCVCCRPSWTLRGVPHMMPWQGSVRAA